MNKIILLFVTVASISCHYKPTAKNDANLKSQKKTENQLRSSDNTDDSKKIMALNQIILQNEEDLSPKDIMRLYYSVRHLSEEGNEKIEIIEKAFGTEIFHITLIHDNLLDDSTRGKKYEMILKRSKEKWIIDTVKKSWRCWEGRGHTDWGITHCR